MIWKNIYITISTLAIIGLLFAYITKPVKSVIRTVEKETFDTVLITKLIPVEKVIKLKPEIRYIEVPKYIVLENPDSCNFCANIFDKYSINSHKLTTNDLFRYILTKPFTATDSLITAKNDTITTNFHFNYEYPAVFEINVNYSPEQYNEIIKTIEINKKEWHEATWFRISTHVLAVLLTAYTVK